MKTGKEKVRFNIIFSALICICCIVVLSAIFIFSNQNIKTLVAFMVITVVLAIVSLALLVFAIIKYHRLCLAEDEDYYFKEEGYISATDEEESESDITENANSENSIPENIE